MHEFWRGPPGLAELYTSTEIVPGARKRRAILRCRVRGSTLAMAHRRWSTIEEARASLRAAGFKPSRVGVKRRSRWPSPV